MKILNFGSLNIDRVYGVTHMVKPGETITAESLNTYAGGKGLNQSIAAARAGGHVLHLGAIGNEGGFLAELLQSAGADTENLLRLDAPSGHAIIQVEPGGQNSIIVFGGANRLLTKDYVLSCLEKGEKGDFVLLQNETSETATIISEAARRGLTVVFNPSPFTESIKALPLSDVGLFIVNEIEGAALAGMSENDEPEKILAALSGRYPKADIVMTLGTRGVICQVGGEIFRQGIFRVDAVDTTAAGDTFCGYLLASRCKGRDMQESLRISAAASAVSVSRAGAAPSIPTEDEVLEFLRQRQG